MIMKLIIADMEDFNIPVEGEYKVIRVNGDIHHCIGWRQMIKKNGGKTRDLRKTLE